MPAPLISTGSFSRDTLHGKVALVTGAGSGIGYEAARALAWLGAHVVIAEINKVTGRAAEQRIVAEMGPDSAFFVHTDIGNERSVARLARLTQQRFGQVDVVLNNATVSPVGPIHEVPVSDWDFSYRVNTRGPVLLAKAFLPGMLQRDFGVFVCVSSSGAAPFMGPYEVFKTAQMEMANTLAAETEGTGVYAFTIGPGLAPDTPGAASTIPKIAKYYGKTVAQFHALSEKHIISIEAAGAGFAAAIALAAQFHGQEISSMQALKAAGISTDGNAGPAAASRHFEPSALAAALPLCRRVRETLSEQAAGWRNRPLFERQWVARDFRKTAGMSVELWLETLQRLEESLATAASVPVAQSETPVPQNLALQSIAASLADLPRLAAYYAHLQELAKGYEKDQAKLAEHLAIVQGWEQEVQQLCDALK